MKITGDMEEWFEVEMRGHILKVRKNLFAVRGAFEGIDDFDIEARAIRHDMSKFKEPEGFIWMIYRYSQRKRGLFTWDYPTERVNDVVRQALRLHQYGNRHHPEFHDLVRTKGSMPLLDAVEMVADMTARSQDQGETSCRSWLEANIDIRWPNFSTEFKSKLWHIVSVFEEKLDDKMSQV